MTRDQELAHRSGKRIDGKLQKIAEKDVLEAIGAVEDLVNHIEQRWGELNLKTEPKFPDDISF